MEDAIMISEDELRKLDYEKTIAFIDQLSGIRFKLLALVPLATGTALGFSLGGKEPTIGAALGLVGFFVTVGIVFYDQRNTEIYEKQIRRAKLLELRLNLPPVSSQDSFGGPLMGRPKRGRKLFGKIEMWHDRALILIYSITLGSWAYLFTASLLRSFTVEEGIYKTTGSIIAFVILIVFWQQLHKLDKSNNPELKALDKEIEEIVRKGKLRALK